MMISNELIYSIVGGGCGVFGSYKVGSACADGVRRMYEPILNFTSQYKDCNDFVVPFRKVLGNIFGDTIPDTVEHFYLNMSMVDKVIRVSERAGLRSALLVGSIESTIAFFRAWQKTNERPWVVDIMEGGLRGSAIGCGAAMMLGKDTESKGVQLITGTVIGFVSGMLASFAGSVSGYAVKKLLAKTEA